MQSYVYVLGSAAGGGEVRVYEKEGKCEWFVRRWGMSARIAKPSIAQDSYQSALGWGDYHILPPSPLPLTTSSRKESGRLYEEERTRLMNQSSIGKRSHIPCAHINQPSDPHPFSEIHSRLFQ